MFKGEFFYILSENYLNVLRNSTESLVKAVTALIRSRLSQPARLLHLRHVVRITTTAF